MNLESKTTEKEVTTLWEDFRNGRAYQSNIGLTTKIPMYVRFYEGDQWPKPTKLTQGLPRPVVNIVKMICRNKKSAILSTPVRCFYQSSDDSVDVERFNHFSDYIQKEIGQDRLDKKGIDSAVKKGGYFYHYYWDSEARGKEGIKLGALRCEMIDILNIFFADPTEDDEQKQRWILISSREPVSSVREKCDKDVDPESIVPDESEEFYSKKEQEGSDLVTVLTRYFRRDGEVFVEKATKTVIINKPFALTPDYHAARAELDVEPDAPNNDLPDNPNEKQDKKEHYQKARATLYPIVAGSYEPRERCIYGLGEVEGLIQNQRSINFNIAMMLLAAQENGWGKYVVGKDALQGQVITNEPGQVLIDYTPGGGGIKRLSELSMPATPMQLVESLTEMTRAVTGATEVMTGETIGSNMSGAAIAQLQSTALVPLEDLKDSFWKVKEKQGQVLAQFYKLFYRNKEFTYTVTADARDEQGNTVEQETRKSDIFDGFAYEDADLEVVVEATGGTKASAAGDINALDVALAKGVISPVDYFELYPKDALSNRSEILKRLKSEEANRVVAMQAQIEQLTQALQMREQQIAEQKKTVESVTSIIKENEQLRITLAKVYQEAKQKITELNKIALTERVQLGKTEEDARIMAQDIAADRRRKKTIEQAQSLSK
jgi:hypothetical protein